MQPNTPPPVLANAVQRISLDFHMRVASHVTALDLPAHASVLCSESTEDTCTIVPVSNGTISRPVQYFDILEGAIVAALETRPSISYSKQVSEKGILSFQLFVVKAKEAKPKAAKTVESEVEVKPPVLAIENPESDVQS